MFPRTIALPNPLKEEHRKLFHLLLEVNRVRNINVVLRVAGGWVRDALLGTPSNDIDVAIESPCDPVTGIERRHVTGEAFAREIVAFQEALHAQQQRQGGGEDAVTCKTVSVIKVNPEKSKHIETAQLTVNNIPLEFCHLRHDAYCTITRVPTIRPGSPTEDALRRDFTINALYYNLHTELVEDYSTGLEDMDRRLLRCPLEPSETFVDDPLRMLRGIRFAGQLGFKLDDSVVNCVDRKLLDALDQKVSRERLGIEWSKMMGGRAPATCWSYIQHMGLPPIVMHEMYLKKGGKPCSTSAVVGPGVERVSSLISADEREQASLYVAWSRLVELAIPCTAAPSSAAYQEEKHHRLVAVSFLLSAPTLRGVASDVRADRLSAWATNGLKLPTIIASGVRRMHDALDAIESLGVDELMRCATTSWVGVPRDTVFDALMVLHDRAVPSNALAVVILAAITLNRSEGASLPDDLVGQVMQSLNADGSILASARSALPIRGDELPASLSIPAKEIGKYLLAARRYMLHHPKATREDVMAHLRVVKDE